MQLEASTLSIVCTPYDLQSTAIAKNQPTEKQAS